MLRYSLSQQYVAGRMIHPYRVMTTPERNNLNDRNNIDGDFEQDDEEKVDKLLKGSQLTIVCEYITVYIDCKLEDAIRKNDRMKRVQN